MQMEDVTLPRSVPFGRVALGSGFWGAKQQANRLHTIPAIYERLHETGRLDVWDLDRSKDPRLPGSVVHMFWDSDTGKWIEAAAFSLRTHPDAALERTLDDLIDRIARAQQPDGYLNTYFTTIQPDRRWKNLRDWHEMYNAGHLIEGAIAYFNATGKRKLLDVMARFADHIAERFGPHEGQRRGYPGHPELELALVKLYRATGVRRYLDLAVYFIDERGRQPSYFDREARERGEDPADFWAKTYHYCQAHVPLREQDAATGHAVRACYLYAGVADVALETGDHELVALAKRLWDDLTQHQLYVTGGLGPARSNEGFTFAYDLPNETAYAETCASIALGFWAHRMFQIDPDSRYIDELERAFYNTVLAGVSAEGDHFFYANPLASYPNVNPHSPLPASAGHSHYRREPWFFCPCCPPNLARLVASIGDYFYATSAGRLYVHLYDTNTAQIDLAGHAVTIRQQTDYPWDGRIQLTLGLQQPAAFELALRVPGWCRSYTAEVNGQRVDLKPQRGYLIIDRTWSDNDTVVLTLAMPIDRIVPHPEIRQNAGQFALQRGPLVYCLEEADNGPRLANIIIPETSRLRAERDPGLWNGIMKIVGNAVRVEPIDWEDGLYRPHSDVHYTSIVFQFSAVPYFLWANREPGEMRVWIRAT